MKQILVAAGVVAGVAAVAGAGVVGCGSSDDDEGTELTTTWRFESGDCASNGVDKVRVTVTPTGGAPVVKEFACNAGNGDLLKISAGSYGIKGEGLDASGRVLFSASQTASFPQGKVLAPLDMTLRAAPSSVTVTWKGCPSGFVLPYTITLFKGTSTTDKFTSVSQSCESSKAVIEGVPPGSYTVDLDSRAVSPKVKAQAPVTVKAGEDASVSIDAP